MSDQPKYMQQWERVNRWFKRFKDTSESKEISQSTTLDEDDVYAFFMNCYHLKDWIRNDCSAGQMRNLVESFINESEALRLCADLCNGLKHLSLDNSRSRQDPRFGQKTQRVFLHVNPPLICQGYTIVTDTKTYDAFDVAWQCVMDWWQFISYNQAHPTSGSS